MNTFKIILPIAAALLLAGQAAAQDTEAEIQSVQERKVEIEAREAEFEEQMREAEAGLAEAAQRIAELSLACDRDSARAIRGDRLCYRGAGFSGRAYCKRGDDTVDRSKCAAGTYG